MINTNSSIYKKIIIACDVLVIVISMSILLGLLPQTMPTLAIETILIIPVLFDLIRRVWEDYEK